MLRIVFGLAFFLAVLEVSNALSFSRDDAGFMEFKKWYWNDPAGVRQCDFVGYGMKGCNSMTTEEKVQALRSNMRGSDHDILEFMVAVQKHAKRYQWMEGGYVYSFCKFYQKDLSAVVKHLRMIVKADKGTQAAGKGDVLEGVTAAAQNGVTKEKSNQQDVEVEVKLNIEKVEDGNGEPGEYDGSAMARSWLSWLQRSLGFGFESTDPMSDERGTLPAPATNEFESTGQTAIGYARAVACFFVPCDLAVRLFSSISTRVLGVEL